MEGYDMSLEQLARIITFFIVVVTIIFAFIASYLQHDNIVNSLCKFAGQQAAKKLMFDLINDIFLTAHNNSKTIETTQQIKREFDIKRQQKQQEQLHRQQEESKYQNIRHIRLNKEQNSLLGSIGLGDFTS